MKKSFSMVVVLVFIVFACVASAEGCMHNPKVTYSEWEVFYTKTKEVCSRNQRLAVMQCQDCGEILTSEVEMVETEHNVALGHCRECHMIVGTDWGLIMAAILAMMIAEVTIIMIILPRLRMEKKRYY